MSANSSTISISNNKSGVESDLRDSEKSARVVIDENERIVFVNDSLCELLGLVTINILGKSFSDCFVFLDKDEEQPIIPDEEYVVKRVNDNKKTTIIFKMIGAPKGRHYMLGSIGSSETEDLTDKSQQDSLLRVVSIAEKKFASKRAKANPQFLASEDYFHFVNMSHELMVKLSSDAKFVSVNSTFTKMLGYSSEELRGESFVELVQYEDRELLKNKLTELAAEAAKEGRVGSVDVELGVKDRENNTRWVDWRIKCVDGGIFCAGSDLTDIKSHEQILRRREQQLFEAESIGSMGHWHWKIGEPSISFSDEIYRIFGVEVGSFTPSLDSMGGCVHKRDVGRLLQAFQRAILEGNDYDMEFRVVRSDNSIRYVRCQGRCEKNPEGEVIGLFGIMQDITERVLYEINLKDAKESVERAYAAKSQFLANMSHELRTPLNAIIGFSEIIQKELMGPIGQPKYMEYIDGIKTSGEHLLALISDILNMSRIEAGKYDMDLENIDVSHVIKSAVQMVASKANEAGIKVGTRFDEDEIAIVADRRAIMQIVLNLLSNAIKFSKSGGRVDIECLKREDYIVIKVLDEGIGIPANKLSSVTRPFEQVSSQYSRNHEGSGLGLAITKELAELHGGTIHIDSAVGVGTTVTIRLPIDLTSKFSK